MLAPLSVANLVGRLSKYVGIVHVPRRHVLLGEGGSVCGLSLTNERRHEKLLSIMGKADG
jgi:hypothetical protein